MREHQRARDRADRDRREGRFAVLKPPQLFARGSFRRCAALFDRMKAAPLPPNSGGIACLVGAGGRGFALDQDSRPACQWLHEGRSCAIRHEVPVIRQAAGVKAQGGVFERRDVPERLAVDRLDGCDRSVTAALFGAGDDDGMAVALEVVAAPEIAVGQIDQPLLEAHGRVDDDGVPAVVVRDVVQPGSPTPSCRRRSDRREVMLGRSSCESSGSWCWTNCDQTGTKRLPWSLCRIRIYSSTWHESIAASL